MPLPVIAGAFRCALLWDGPGAQTAANIIHVAVPGSTDPQDAMDFLDDNVTSNMWAVVADSAHIASVEITPLDGTSGAQVFTPDTAANWDGATGGNSVPQVAAIVKLTTGQRGRSKRGRIYLPFISEGAIADGLITSGDLAAMQTAWTNFVAAGVGGVGLLVASYLLEDAEDVTAATVETTLGTQRRRQSRLR